jgi:hypothetical protein
MNGLRARGPSTAPYVILGIAALLWTTGRPTQQSWCPATSFNCVPRCHLRWSNGSTTKRSAHNGHVCSPLRGNGYVPHASQHVGDGPFRPRQLDFGPRLPGFAKPARGRPGFGTRVQTPAGRGMEARVCARPLGVAPRSTDLWRRERQPASASALERSTVFTDPACHLPGQAMDCPLRLRLLRNLMLDGLIIYLPQIATPESPLFGSTDFQGSPSDAIWAEDRGLPAIRPQGSSPQSYEKM